MATRIQVDRGRCVGIAMCESVDPDRFEVDDDGYLHVTDTTVEEPDLSLVTEAVKACPAVALALVSPA